MVVNKEPNNHQWCSVYSRLRRFWLWEHIELFTQRMNRVARCRESNRYTTTTFRTYWNVLYFWQEIYLQTPWLLAYATFISLGQTVPTCLKEEASSYRVFCKKICSLRWKKGSYWQGRARWRDNAMPELRKWWLSYWITPTDNHISSIYI